VGGGGVFGGVWCLVWGVFLFVCVFLDGVVVVVVDGIELRNMES
jgi:hypothetical protein